jgi:hypothetical protein
MFGANGLLSSVSKFADAWGDFLTAEVSGGAVSGEREENARSPIDQIVSFFECGSGIKLQGGGILM